MVKVQLDDFDQIQGSIDKDDLNLEEGGFEDDPHVTIKFGVAGDPSMQALVDSLYEMSDLKPKKIRYKGVSLFSSDTRDVLKFDIEASDELLAMRAVAESKFDCSGDEHPEYHAHVTIAFLKPGAGAKYVNPDVEGSMTTGMLTYSSAGRKYKLNLNV